MHTELQSAQLAPFNKLEMVREAIRCCCLLSVLPLVVGLTGGIAASLNEGGGMSPPWDMRAGYLMLAASCMAIPLRALKLFLGFLLLGASWLGGAYARKNHPIFHFGDEILPIRDAFFLTTGFGVAFGMLVGVVWGGTYYCCPKVRDFDASSPLAFMRRRFYVEDSVLTLSSNVSTSTALSVDSMV